MISVLLDYNLSETRVPSDVTACSQLALFANEVPVISGGWQCKIRFKGKRIRRVGEWKEVDSQYENDCEFIEIELELEGGFKLKRFCLLDTVNRIFFACDLVLGELGVGQSCGVGLQYESSIICSDKLQPLPSDKSNCCDIIFKPCPKVRGSQKPASFRVVPLALSAVKFLNADKNGISICQNFGGLSMLIPLFFDFKLSRLGKTILWRELTVGENLEKVTTDKAAGYRIKIDKDQFLLYRSLTSPASRTLLGHNLIDEFCYAKFDPKSGVNPLLTK
ncbi:MAG: hypothetical protein LBT09_05630 [Planctomycetaceae bacterium]|jgi:hypothetical protein|nr:hypothetical protein [Planctomycetaceae bacterium]